MVEEADGLVSDSKFGGMPWLTRDEPWPLCQHCHQPMPLFVQLNLDTLPGGGMNSIFGSGLLQLFYCTNAEPHCESECKAFLPFTPGKLARIVTHGSEGRTEFWKPGLAVKPQRIVGWDKRIDYPGWEEGHELGIELSDADWERLARTKFPVSGDKLAGWPLWLQGIEYPACPICQTRMRLVFQLDSDDHLAYHFGDAGCGHITQCPIHHSQVAFAWACS